MPQWEKDLLNSIKTNSPLDYLDSCTKNCPIEISERNRSALLEYFLKIKEHCSSILEIGVHRNGVASFTSLLLENKNKNTIYFGVDIADKSYLDNKSENVYTVRKNSADLEKIMEYAFSLGISKFDFIMIDGNHSIDHILKDWEYTKYLSDIGIVAIHDTAYHYGPNKLINNLNPNIWNIVTNACQDDEDDFGIGFVWKK